MNFVALLGWSPAEDREIYSLPELVEAFDYTRISKSPAVFDMTKLKWMNGEYMKAMDDQEFYERALPYMKEALPGDYDFRKLAAMVKTRIEIFPDIPELLDFFREVPEYDASMYRHKKMKTTEETSLAVLRDTLPILEAQEDYSNDALFAVLSAYGKEKGYKTDTSCGPCAPPFPANSPRRQAPRRSWRSWEGMKLCGGSARPSTNSADGI